MKRKVMFKECPLRENGRTWLDFQEERSQQSSNSNVLGQHSRLRGLCSVSSWSVVVCLHNANEASLRVVWYWHLDLLLDCGVSELNSLALSFWKFCEFHISYNDFSFYLLLAGVGSIVCNWKPWSTWVDIFVSYCELINGILVFLILIYPGTLIRPQFLSLQDREYQTLGTE